MTRRGNWDKFMTAVNKRRAGWQRAGGGQGDAHLTWTPRGLDPHEKYERHVKTFRSEPFFDAKKNNMLTEKSKKDSKPN